jgi:DNA polymerase-3 subunit epsilon
MRRSEMRYCKLAFVDIETTGLDPEKHEIIDIAVVVVEPGTLEPVLQWSAKILPEHIETADPWALEVNGYTPDGWRHAMPMHRARIALESLLGGAVLAGHAVCFDREFILRHVFHGDRDSVGRYVLDTGAVAVATMVQMANVRPSLSRLCKHLGVENRAQHTALGDVEATLECARRMLLPLRGVGERRSGPMRVYICHPLRGDQEENIRKVKKAVAGLLRAEGTPVIPVAPHLYLPQVLDDSSPEERGVAMKACLSLLDSCDELWVLAEPPSEGMAIEIAHAESRGIRIRRPSNISGNPAKSFKSFLLTSDGRGWEGV